MAIRVTNKTKQEIPLIIPVPGSGGYEVRIPARATRVLALDEATPQMKTLSAKGKIKIR